MNVRRFFFGVFVSTFILLSLSSVVSGNEKVSKSTPTLTLKALKNAEYKHQDAASGVAKLTDGVYKERFTEEQGSEREMVIELIPESTAFGDLDGDGVDDAAVLLMEYGGGSGIFISLSAVINDKGAPKPVATVSLGDRTKITSVVIKSREIILTMVTHGPNDAMCCPTLKVTQKYTLQGGKLVELSGEDKGNTGK